MNLQWAELLSDGITIGMKDVGGNVIPQASLPDPATVTLTYACSDPTVVAVTQPPATAPYSTVGKSSGKSGTGLSISCTMAFISGAPSLTGTSQLFDVPPGAPAELDVNLGTPA